MDSLSAFAIGEATKNQPQMAFDWDKAAAIIKQRNPNEATAGLSQDLEWTAGIIWRYGKPVVDSYTYLSSSWAIPVLVIDDEEIPCWRYAQDSGYDAHTKWPTSALAALTEE